MSETSQTSPLLAYHARTRHRFDAYAEGPGQLDWDAQPDPFRRYPGAPLCELPLTGDQFERRYGELEKPPEIAIAPHLASLGTLLELAYGISAWKSWGPNRWALRCNPSSGNLHPVEAYVLAAGVPGLIDGLHHYDPKDHLLEGRALRSPDGSRWLAVGLSSVMWLEAWKYGERAFRYCQLDVGHAMATLAYAAALLGWRVRPLAIAGDTLASLLGFDRPGDFPPSRFAFTEAEEPEVLLAIDAPGLGDMPADPLSWLADAFWQGMPSQVDPAPGYRWQVIAQAASASRSAASVQAAVRFPDYTPLAEHMTTAGAAQLIRQRRSGQRFDPKHALDKADFYRLLDATLPRPGVPFGTQEAAPAIALLLFVLRVDGLPPGLYLLPRTPAAADSLPALLGTGAGRFTGRCAVADVDHDCPPHLQLTLLAALELPELQRLARALSCHQDIAATGAFSLGMLADFSAVAGDGHAYRRLLREAGLIGQVLYLEAEAAGVRGTGIGCFFDEPVRDAFGLKDTRWQPVYHFTVGLPVVDPRIETGPPYPQRSSENP